MSTYLELTNLLLRRLNDTELTQSNFATATSTQASAKDCIRAAIQEIYSEETTWPFRYRSGSQLLTVGQEQYALPSSAGDEVSSVDWNSFRIQGSTVLGVSTTPLEFISHDEWKKYLRATDEDSSTTGVGIPRYVFLTQGATANDYLGFGVSPSPSVAYTVLFDYNAVYPEFEDHDDETGIPERFDYVIINYALKHFYMFKDNTEQAGYWSNEAKRSLAKMRRNLMPKQDGIRSRVVNYGGGVGSGRWSIGDID